MKITTEILESLQACTPAINAFKEHLVEKNLKSISLEELINEIINKNNYFNWGSWLLTHLMTREENIAYAIFAAKQVLPIFEARYPEDERPRKAIEAAEQYLSNKTSDAAAYVAVNYAYAAYYAAYTAHAAAHAAHSAYAAAYAAAHATNADDDADAAAHADDAAGDAVNNAYAASADDDANKSKILLYGLKIIQL